MPCCEHKEGSEGQSCDCLPLQGERTEIPKKIWMILAGIGVGILAAAMIVSVLVYTRPVGDAFVGKVVKIVPYPAAVVGTHTVSMRDLYEEYRAMQNYFSSLDTPPDMTNEDVITMIMQTLVRKVSVRELMQAYDLVLDEDAVTEMYTSMVNQVGGEEILAQKISETFGWTTEVFRDRVVTPLVMADQLTTFVEESEEIQGERLEEVESYRQRVTNGEAFLDVANEVMTAYEMNTQGDYGEVALEDLPEEWQTALEGIGDGGMTEVIEGSGVSLVLFVQQRIVVEEAQSGTESVDLQFLAVPDITLEDKVAEYLEDTWVWKIVGEEVAEEEVIEEGEDQTSEEAAPVEEETITE
ncbi:TPA: hypothetical protein DEP34_00865 [Candidatus Uhrbacteria bacterium]|nr:hypothetical protein [Candidatus Uhrbacteria bacterium]HCB18922.1 hypothetical protein [Candidatus Uhrbacteria bacterium]